MKLFSVLVVLSSLNLGMAGPARGGITPRAGCGDKGNAGEGGGGGGRWRGGGKWRGGGDSQAGGGGGSSGAGGPPVITTEEVETMTILSSGKPPAPQPTPTTSAHGGGGGGGLEGLATITSQDVFTSTKKTTADPPVTSQTNQGGGTPAKFSKEDWIAAHNRARAAYGAGPVTWHDGAEGQSRANAEGGKGTCALSHTPDGEREYGENLTGGGINMDHGAEGVVKGWMDETGAWESQNGGITGHFTQVVWKATTGIGCAVADCGGGGHYIACSYDPPGNYGGQYEANVGSKVGNYP